MRRRRGWEQKFIFISLALVLAVSIIGLTACGGDDDEDTPTPTKTTVATVVPPPAIKPPTATTTAPPATTVAPPPTAAPAFTINSSMGTLVKDPATNAILRKCLGDDVVDNPQLEMAYDMDLPTIGPMSAGKITDAMIACVKDGLAALASGGTPKPAAPAFTINSSMGTLVKDPATNAILRKCLGDDVVDNPQLEMAYDMDLPTIGPMSAGKITDAMIACVKDGLAALASGGTPKPAAPAFTINSSMGTLVKDPATNAILRKCLGDDVVDNPQLEMAYDMDLPTIGPMSAGKITDAMIACVKEGLAALASGGTPTATVAPPPTTVAPPPTTVAPPPTTVAPPPTTVAPPPTTVAPPPTTVAPPPTTAAPPPTTVAPTATAAPTPVIHTGLDINSTFSELANNADTKAVLVHCYGQEAVDKMVQYLAMLGSKTIKGIQDMSSGSMTDDQYKCATDGLAAIK